MKRMSAGVAILLLAACGGGEDEGETLAGASEQLPFTEGTVGVEVRPATDTSTWVVHTGMLASVPMSGNAATIPVLEEERQLIWVEGAGNSLRMAAIKEPGQVHTEINALSTAISLLVLHPLFIQFYEADPRGTRERLESLEAVRILAGVIAKRPSESTESMATDVEVQQALRQALETAYESFSLVAPASGKPMYQPQKVSIHETPGGGTSGVRVEKERYDADTQTLHLKVINPLSRWATAIVEDANSQMLDESLVPSKGEALLVVPATHATLRVRVLAPIGTGFLVGYDAGETLLPLLITIIDNFVLPMIDILTGIKTLRQVFNRFRQVGLKNLLTKFGPTGLQDSDHWIARWIKRVFLFHGPAQIREWWRSKEGPATLVKIALVMIGALADNHFELLWDALGNALGNLALDLGARLLQYLVPGFTQIWAAVELTSAAFSVGKTLYDAWWYPKKEVFGVENLPPTLSLEAAPTTGTIPLTVSFTARSPYPIRKWEWDFRGDGTWVPGSSRASYPYRDRGEYRAKVRATDEDGAVAEAEVVIVAKAVSAPTNLKARVPYGKGSEVQLDWQNASNGEEGIEIVRSTDLVKFTWVTEEPTGSTRFVDRGLSSGTTYYYRVRARSQGGWSEWSILEEVTTPVPPKITGGKLLREGENYSEGQLLATGGEGHTWTISKGTMPNGWRLDPSGFMRVTWSVEERDYSFTIRITTSAGLYDEWPVFLPAVDPESVPKSDYELPKNGYDSDHYYR